jgi:hypothetical protein
LFILICRYVIENGTHSFFVLNTADRIAFIDAVDSTEYPGRIIIQLPYPDEITCDRGGPIPCRFSNILKIATTISQPCGQCPASFLHQLPPGSSPGTSQVVSIHHHLANASHQDKHHALFRLEYRSVN